MISDMELDFWNERAAIMQFDAGMSRFRAETKAAQAMGRQRWEFVDAERKRDFASGGDHRQAVAGQQRKDNVPAMQRAPEKEG